MRIFETRLMECLQLLEQDLAPDPNLAQPAPDGNAGAPQAEQPPQQAPVQPSSVGFAVVTQIVLDALRVKQVRNPSDTKYSDNKARTTDEAWKYLDIVSRNLPNESQAKAQQDVGKSGQEDLDELNIVDMANLALKALFFVPKLVEEDGTEYSSLANITKVTTENAQEVFNELRSFLSTR